MPDTLREPLPELRTRREHVSPDASEPVPIRILLVHEGLPAGSPGASGVGSVVDALRDRTEASPAHLQVTLARWAYNPAHPVRRHTNPGAYEATYTSYRFASVEAGMTAPILSGFDEVWLFGTSPEVRMPKTREAVFDSALCPTQEDLEAITRFMNAGGGVLAMGGRASAGAYLCARIPRVWTMRRWADDDEHAPEHGSWLRDPARIDLAAKVEFPVPGSLSAEEYPQASDVRPRPELVTRRGAMAIYDGHAVDVGRVTLGDLGRPPEADAESVLAAYYRELALWLAPPAKQRRMLAHTASRHP